MGKKLKKDLLVSQVKANVKWTLSPPYGPHHGGIYEIMVEATKRALNILCNDSDVTLDEFRTFVSRVAALINSRPLSRVNLDNQGVILTWFSDTF